MPCRRRVPVLDRPRVVRLLLGLAAAGAGIALIVRANLGLGPWDVLHQGISQRTGVPIGMVVVGVGFAVLLLWFPLHQRVGVGTVANAVVVGTVIDLTLWVVPESTGLLPQWAFLLGGTVAVGIGSGLYLSADLGPGPRDGLMTNLAARGPSVRLVRTGIELSALALGWLLGGTVGIGTLVFALSIGPPVQFFLHRLTPTPPETVAASAQ